MGLSKKEIKEGKWADLFREVLKDDSILEVRRGKIIDFLFLRKDEVIGVEVTGVYQTDLDANGFTRRQIESESESFTNRLIKRLEDRLDFKFAIGITWNDSKSLRTEIVSSLLEELEILCLTELSQMNDREIKRLVSSSQYLSIQVPLNGEYFSNASFVEMPNGVEDVLIARFDHMEYSFDMMRVAGTLPMLLQDDLKTLIRGKEEKLLSYEPCSQYWLLITEEGSPSMSFSDVVFDYPIDSQYDRIFLIRGFSKDLINLK